MTCQHVFRIWLALRRTFLVGTGNSSFWIKSSSNGHATQRIGISEISVNRPPQYQDQTRRTVPAVVTHRLVAYSMAAVRFYSTLLEQWPLERSPNALHGQSTQSMNQIFFHTLSDTLPKTFRQLPTVINRFYSLFVRFLNDFVDSLSTVDSQLVTPIRSPQCSDWLSNHSASLSTMSFNQTSFSHYAKL